MTKLRQRFLRMLAASALLAGLLVPALAARSHASRHASRHPEAQGIRLDRIHAMFTGNGVIVQDDPPEISPVHPVLPRP